jgi:hypothetical protein
LGGLRGIVLPIAVLQDNGAVVGSQLKGGIGQGVGDFETDKRWSNGSHGHVLGCVPGDNESANQDVIPGFNPHPVAMFNDFAHPAATPTLQSETMRKRSLMPWPATAAGRLTRVVM